MPKPLAWLWASPWTAVGVAIGMLGVTTGGKARRRSGTLEFYGGVIPKLLAVLPGGPCVMAMTLGHVILGSSPAALDCAHEHELVHVRQYERWGPLFIPAYLACSAYIWFRGGDAYRDNPFEREAFAIGPGNL